MLNLWTRMQLEDFFVHRVALHSKVDFLARSRTGTGPQNPVEERLIYAPSELIGKASCMPPPLARRLCVSRGLTTKILHR
jgi:hypothetical protein